MGLVSCFGIFLKNMVHLNILFTEQPVVFLLYYSIYLRPKSIVEP